MSGLRPQQPEAVTYDVYEDSRESNLPPASLHCGEMYTVRLRHQKPTPEVFAYDFATKLTALKNLGGFCVVEYVFRNPGLVKSETGVSRQGFIFDYTQKSIDPDNLSRKEEWGYFVGRLEGTRGRGEVPDEDLAEEGRVVDWEPGRELVLAH